MDSNMVRENSVIRTYVAFVLDKSGSMNNIKKLAISGFNEHVQTLISEGNKAGETFVSLVLFNNQVEANVFNAPVYALKELTEESYVPNGNTAYYDAVKYTLDRLNNETNFSDPNNAYLIIIISDGQDNASKTLQKALSERIEHLKETNKWTFVFIGSNQNLSTVQTNLSLDFGNVYKGWDSTDIDSTLKMASVSNKNMRIYLMERSNGLTSTSNYCELHENCSSDVVENDKV